MILRAKRLVGKREEILRCVRAIPVHSRKEIRDKKNELLI